MAIYKESTIRNFRSKSKSCNASCYNKRPINYWIQKYFVEESLKKLLQKEERKNPEFATIDFCITTPQQINARTPYSLELSPCDFFFFFLY